MRAISYYGLSGRDVTHRVTTPQPGAGAKLLITSRLYGVINKNTFITAPVSRASVNTRSTLSLDGGSYKILSYTK